MVGFHNRKKKPEWNSLTEFPNKVVMIPGLVELKEEHYQGRVEMLHA